jgi:hypothetical protein
MKKKISLEVIAAQNVLTVELDSTAYVKWENRAKAVNVPLRLLLSLFLTEEVQRT